MEFKNHLEEEKKQTVLRIAVLRWRLVNKKMKTTSAANSFWQDSRQLSSHYELSCFLWTLNIFTWKLEKHTKLERFLKIHLHTTLNTRQYCKVSIHIVYSFYVCVKSKQRNNQKELEAFSRGTRVAFTETSRFCTSKNHIIFRNCSLVIRVPCHHHPPC